MLKFRKVFGNNQCSIIAMIHALALPGTPNYDGNFHNCIERVKFEANIYKKHNLDALLLENMHDVPYVRDHRVHPETIACMTRLSHEIRQILPDTTPCGLQVLACGNREALAIAKAADLQFIRAEGFVFAHVADEGYTDACAGDLLRYRRMIGAESVLVLTDLKKKHSSHAITDDVTLLETAHAAEFFSTDGIVLTGTATGHAANTEDLDMVYNKVQVPILIGSGVTQNNLSDYYAKSQGIIIGSHFKRDGKWENELCEQRISGFMNKVLELRCNKTSQ